MKPLKELLETIREHDKEITSSTERGYLAFAAGVHFSGGDFYPLAECEGCLREVTRIAKETLEEDVRECAEGLLHYKAENRKE